MIRTNQVKNKTIYEATKNIWTLDIWWYIDELLLFPLRYENGYTVLRF